MNKIKLIEAGINQLDIARKQKSFRFEKVNLDLIILDLKYLLSEFKKAEKENKKLSAEIKKLKGGKTNDKTRNKN